MRLAPSNSTGLDTQNSSQPKDKVPRDGRMGLTVFKITGEREAVALECDRSAHGDCVRTAWFDCSSRSGSLFLAKAVGWIERQGAPGVWLCPRCAQGRDQEAGIALNRQPVGSPPVSQTHPGRHPAGASPQINQWTPLSQRHPSPWTTNLPTDLPPITE